MIDFVTTTPFRKDECKKFGWSTRGMLVFPEYPPLISGIEEQVKQFEGTIQEAKRVQKDITAAEETTKQSLSEINRRIDTFLALVFTVVAVLFTGLGIVATTRPDERTSVNPPVWIAAIALYFALRASSSSGTAKDKWYSRRAVAFLIAAATIVASLVDWNAHFLSKEIGDAKKEASEAAKAVDKEKRDREAAIQSLDQQLKLLQPAKSKGK